MRAAVYERTGPAAEVLRLIDVPVPEPGAGEVRVRLAWSGVNPSDVKTRGGLRTNTLPFPRIIPHSDGAGVIDQVGQGVPVSRVGERVWVWNAAWGRPDGTAAEYVVLPTGQAVPLPDRIDLVAGACLGIPALTAYQAVAVDGGVRGQTVLVAGGAGAVGHYAVQLAKLEGARQVIATVSGPEKAALAEAAGADWIVNYRTEDLVARCREATEGEGVDRIIEVDFAANAAVDFALVKPEGDVVVYGSGAPEISVPFVPAILNNVRLRFFIVYNLNVADRKRAVARITELLKADRLTHNVAARLSLERIVEAHEMVEHGSVAGNVVLEVG